MEHEMDQGITEIKQRKAYLLNEESRVVFEVLINGQPTVFQLLASKVPQKDKVVWRATLRNFQRNGKEQDREMNKEFQEGDVGQAGWFEKLDTQKKYIYFNLKELCISGTRIETFSNTPLIQMTHANNGVVLFSDYIKMQATKNPTLPNIASGVK